MRYKNNRRRHRQMINENFSGADVSTVEEHLANTYFREIAEKIFGELRSSVDIDRVEKRKARNGVYMLHFTGYTPYDHQFSAHIHVYDMFNHGSFCLIKGEYEIPKGSGSNGEEFNISEPPSVAMNGILDFFKVGLGVRR